MSGERVDHQLQIAIYCLLSIAIHQRLEKKKSRFLQYCNVGVGFILILFNLVKNIDATQLQFEFVAKTVQTLVDAQIAFFIIYIVFKVFVKLRKFYQFEANFIEEIDADILNLLHNTLGVLACAAY